MKVMSIIIFSMTYLLSIGNNAAGEAKDKGPEAVLVKILPNEYTNYQKQLIGDNGISDSHATLLLVSKAKEILETSPKNNGEKEDHNKAYYASWCLCLRIHQRTDNQEVKNMILEQWNNSLKKDDDTVPYQVYALTESLGDKSLMTEDFWNLFQKTIKKKTISSICFIVYQNGDKADLERLKQKKHSEIDFELQEIIQKAINYMNYHFSIDKTNPGPAEKPPTMNFHDESLGRTEMVIPMSAIQVTASENDKRKMDKLLDLLEIEINKNNPSVPREVAIDFIAKAVYINKLDPKWKRDLPLLQSNTFNPNALPVPYANDRVVNILAQCFDNNNWQVRKEAIQWLGEIGANDLNKADEITALFNTQLIKEKARNEAEEVKAKREKSIMNSLEKLKHNINESREIPRRAGLGGPQSK